MDTTSSSPKRVPLPTTLDIYETNVYNYRRRVQRLSLRRVRLLATTTRERLPPLRPVNDYFLYETRSALNARFEGITAENDRRGTNALLYEMLMFAPCPNCHCKFLLVSMPQSRGNPVAGSTPPSCMTRSRSLPFVPVSP